MGEIANTKGLEDNYLEQSFVESKIIEETYKCQQKK